MEYGADITLSLSDVLLHEDLSLVFREYLHQQQSSENLSFWVEVEDYKTLENENDRKSRAEKIWDKFLNKSAQTPINIDGSVRDSLYNSISSKEYPIDLFNEAQEFIYSLLELDSYRKFIQSENYQNWISM